MDILINFNDKSPNVFFKKGISGFIKISQKSKHESTKFSVNISGLKPNGLHGFHIHEKPIVNKNDLYKTCDSCGGHYNPTNNDHGSIFNKDNGLNRHVGDLINNIKADSKGVCIIDFWDEQAVLIPSKKYPYTIVGKSIVIHDGTDDLGREGINDHTPYIISNETKSYKINNNLQTKQYTDSKLRKSSKLNGNAGKRIACANIN